MEPNVPTPEFVTHQVGDDEAWICIRGNTPTSEGFYPCNDDGDVNRPGIAGGSIS
jgi:hypothetical protein